MPNLFTNSLIIDTSFILGFSNKRDPNHQKALHAFEAYSDYDWYTTWPVLTEVSHMVPLHVFLNLIKDYQEGLFNLFHIEDEDMDRLLKLFRKYADLEIDLADLSLVLVAEHLSSGDILTFDNRDFSTLRWDKNKPFINLTL